MTTMPSQTWERALLLRAYEAFHTRVIPAIQPVQDKALLALAYAHCDEITAVYGRSFYVATALLPPDKRRAVRALYAFCRTCDNIVDCPQQADVEASFATWRQRVLSPETPSDDLVALAWRDTRLRYRIPHHYAEQLIDGVARDLCQTRYSTFEELATYAYGVASTVGLMSMYIIGFHSADAILYAIRLGVALQLTNILRDVGEDWHAGRVYLPAEELAAYDLSEDDLAAGRVDDRWRAFMRFQIARNHRLYAEAKPGIRLLNGEGRFAVAAAGELYGAILDDIEAHDYDVFNRRAHLTTWGKISRLPRIWLRSREQVH